MGKVYCAACQKRCKGDVLKIEQHFVHPKCFRCAKCLANLHQGGFFVRNKRLYCPGDYQSEFGVKCAQCNNFVEGEVVTVLGKTFHPDCFRCFGCGHLFTSGERTTIVNDAYYCLVCSPSAASTAGTTAINASPTSGITSPSTASPYPDGRLRSAVTDNGSANNKLVDQQRLARLRNTAPPGQLTVHVSENGYANLDSTKANSATLNHFENGVDQSAVDTLFSTTPGQTFSGTNFSPATPSTTNVSLTRNCPPGVDYGSQYPLSYLRLAEHGLTAIMSGDELQSPPSRHRHQQRSRSLVNHHGVYHPPPASRHLPASPVGDGHQSRRDITAISTARYTPASKPIPGLPGHVYNDSFASSSSHGHQTSDYQHRSPATLGSGLPSGTMPSQGSSSIWHFNGHNTPSVPATLVDGRPKRDLYIRRRQLSPGAASLGSGLVGYHSRSPRLTGATILPPCSDRLTHRSTPNVCAKRGMTLLAESLMQPRPRPDRSQSPDSSATEYWIEARRLASYPSARLPDSNSLPAIERFDFPAPPSPAVVMLEKRREKRLTLQRAREQTTSPQNGISASEGRDTVDSSLANGEIVSADLSEKINRIDAEIEKLKRMGEPSGMTAALIQELQANKLAHLREPDLDPVSASRSPSANREPGYKTRYEQHGFASPSRDNRREQRSAARHTLSYGMDYSRTGGRSGAVLNSSMIDSVSTARPGYTSGILCGRAVSLPRPVAIALSNGGARGSLAVGNSALPRPQISTLPVGSHPGQIDGLVDLDDSVRTRVLVASHQPFEQSGIASLTTSALSVTDDAGMPSHNLIANRIAAVPEAYPRGVADDASYYVKAGTLAGGLPPSVTGLRSVRYQRSNTMGSSASRRDDEVTEGDTALLLSPGSITCPPSVQDWLRPTSAKNSRHSTMSFKVYPYDQLRVSSEKPVTKGIDRTKLELYLSDEEFQLLFQMPPSTFQRLPEWKRNDLKKKVDLL